MGICGDHSLEYAVTDPMSVDPIFWLECFSWLFMSPQTEFLEIKGLDFENLSLNSKSPFWNVKGNHFFFFTVLMFCKHNLGSGGDLIDLEWK